MKSVLGLSVVSLYFHFRSGLSLCLRELLGSALVKRQVCLVLVEEFLDSIYLFFLFFPSVQRNKLQLPQMKVLHGSLS